MPSERAIEILALLQVPRVGAATVRRLLKGAAPGASLLSAAGKGAAALASQEDLGKAYDSAKRIVELCSELKIELLGSGDEQFPSTLSAIADFPPIMYVRGDITALGQTCVAVVGTRQASSSGLRIARLIGQSLAKRGITVVSGLALGIDTSAHEGALDGCGRTLAVLAHGLDTVAPKSNRDLAERIIANGGALVSEHPPGTPPHRAEFVRRNRIQSGLSVASVMVESDVEGGAIHQATFTRRQGRKLLVVLAASDATRGNLNEAGAKHLIQSMGATGIRTTGELWQALSRMPESDASALGQPGFSW